MKTTTNNIKFPSTAKLVVFVVLISGLAFVSCMVTNAQISNETPVATLIDEVNDSYADVLKSNVELSGIDMNQVWTARLERALVAETETRLEVEAWMLDFDYFYSAEAYEEALDLEDWMLDTENFTTGETSEEPVELEDWMIQ